MDFTIGGSAWRLAWPLALVGLLLPLFVLQVRQRTAASNYGAIRLPFAYDLPTTSAPIQPVPRIFRFALFDPIDLSGMMILLLLVCAATRPQWIDPVALRPSNGRDILLVLDISASMMTPDLKLSNSEVTRLAVATRFGQRFLGQRRGDRAGLIVFASQPYLYVPLTYDLSAVSSALDGIAVGLAGQKTALGDALALAVKTLTKEKPSANSVVVIISDGANTTGTLTPEQAAWLAAKHQVRVHALLVGKTLEQASPSALAVMASQTGGTYALATDASAVSNFFHRLDEIEPQVRDELSRTAAARELYALPLSAALLLLALRQLVLAARARRPSPVSVKSHD